MFWYVYEHYDAAGKLFYVGKGKDKRAWTSRGRSPEWAEIANKGYTVNIRVSGLDEADALHIEHELIKLNRHMLVNKVSGGGPLTPKKPVNCNPPPKRILKDDNPEQEFQNVVQILMIQLSARNNPRTAVKQAGQAMIRRTMDRSRKLLIQKAMTKIIRSLKGGV
jgi:hypothetical protein